MKESFSGEFDGIKFNTVSNFEVAESTNDIIDSDHVIAIADFVDTEWYETSDKSSIDYRGYSTLGFGKLSFVDSDHFIFGIPAPLFAAARTSAHEMGHNIRGEAPKKDGHIAFCKNLSWLERVTNLMK